MHVREPGTRRHYNLAIRAAARRSRASAKSKITGHTISCYRILEKLGAGGTGEVYKAEDTRLHRFVALRFLPDVGAGLALPRAPQAALLPYDRHALEQFQREAQGVSATGGEHR